MKRFIQRRLWRDWDEMRGERLDSIARVQATFGSFGALTKANAVADWTAHYSSSSGGGSLLRRASIGLCNQFAGREKTRNRLELPLFGRVSPKVETSASHS